MARAAAVERGDAGFAPTDCRVGTGAKGAALRFRGVWSYCDLPQSGVGFHYCDAPTAVIPAFANYGMDPASIDSGLRRNDGWGRRNDGKIGMTEKSNRLTGNFTEGLQSVAIWHSGGV